MTPSATKEGKEKSFVRRLFAITLRKKIVLYGMLLLLLPNIAYLYFSSTEDYLLAGQRQALSHSANTIATMLHERPMLFIGHDNDFLSLQDEQPLQISQSNTPIQLDGSFTDWQAPDLKWQEYSGDALLEQSVLYQASSLSFTHALSRHEDAIYVAFDVVDDVVVFRPSNSPSIDKNDFLLLVLSNDEGQLFRYMVAPIESGWVNAYLLQDNQLAYLPASLETRIQGHWRLTDTGYAIELRFNQNMFNQKLAFAIGDVDDTQSRDLNYLIGTNRPKNVDSLRPVINVLPELEKALTSLDYADSRIWILDRQKRVLAVQGNLNDDVSLPLQASRKAWLEILHHYFLPLYKFVFAELRIQFDDEWKDSFSIDSPVVDLALTGINGVVTRPTSNQKTQVLVAAQPILVEDEVIAVVLAEQSTIKTQRIVREAFEYQITITLLCLFIGAVLLLVFADRIAKRIKVLRNETESAIDSSGKIIKAIVPSKRSDEIGDLSRSFHQVLKKLTQYNHYLQNMASRLSHELRTPVAIVNSSLDNLELGSDNQLVYIKRARDGIDRLSKILQSMSEATRLEEIIKNNVVEQFTLNSLLSSCVDGYKMTHENYEFSLELDTNEHEATGSADLFVQMLDKIVANAVEFSTPNGIVRIRLFSKQSKTCVSVTNYGPLLPENMRGELLDSMVSVRENTANSSSHLGLGLYIAKIIAEYHGGLLEIDNLPDHSGVIALVTFN